MYRVSLVTSTINKPKKKEKEKKKKILSNNAFIAKLGSSYTQLEIELKRETFHDFESVSGSFTGLVCERNENTSQYNIKMCFTLVALTTQRMTQRISMSKENETAIYSGEAVANSKIGGERDSEGRTEECLVAADRLLTDTNEDFFFLLNCIKQKDTHRGVRNFLASVCIVYCKVETNVGSSRSIQDECGFPDYLISTQANNGKRRKDGFEHLDCQSNLVGNCNLKLKEHDPLQRDRMNRVETNFHAGGTDANRNLFRRTEQPHACSLLLLQLDLHQRVWINHWVLQLKANKNYKLAILIALVVLALKMRGFNDKNGIKSHSNSIDLFIRLTSTASSLHLKHIKNFPQLVDFHPKVCNIDFRRKLLSVFQVSPADKTTILRLTSEISPDSLRYPLRRSTYLVKPGRRYPNQVLVRNLQGIKERSTARALAIGCKLGAYHQANLVLAKFTTGVSCTGYDTYKLEQSDYTMNLRFKLKLLCPSIRKETARLVFQFYQQVSRKDCKA
ncbi:hypothetical protein WN51_01271 [Melipona quadrifasciata]|uniref:Uncharacterized protein n=1 Tax=Melipona quadrifasciata TaxID=166423 RepID=A0A0M8ZYJ9_9HYME|nr:hypothetical protein WN51_01271 [Melipona quadrifasciata]